MSLLTQVSAGSSNTSINAQTYLLSIILPTRNESANVAPLLDRITQALSGMSVEVIFVDDSSDNTPGVIRRCARDSKVPVRLIARQPGFRHGGLGGAVVEGIRAATGRWICVMDADLQHPPEMINRLLGHAQDTGSDLVVASRFASGASTPGLDTLRSAISHSFILSARILFFNRLRHVTDPLTGFFLVRREKLDLDRLRPSGFKILLEMIVQFPNLKVSELGFEMATRHSGDSKASAREAWLYFRKLIELRMTLGGMRFVQFLFVGFSGLFVNSLALMSFAEELKLHYLTAAAAATQVSTLWNFILSELWVFREKRQHTSLILRLAGFFLINNALLILRTPIISFLVESVHFNYLTSNLLTLVSATLLRYAIAEKVLWAVRGRNKPAVTRPTQLESSEAAQPVQ